MAGAPNPSDTARICFRVLSLRDDDNGGLVHALINLDAHLIAVFVLNVIGQLLEPFVRETLQLHLFLHRELNAKFVRLFARRLVDPVADTNGRDSLCVQITLRPAAHQLDKLLLSRLLSRFFSIGFRHLRTPETKI